MSTIEAETDPKSQTKKYHLSCHCQAHIISLDLPAENPFPDNGICDCSHCFKKRIVWTSASPGSAKIVKGYGRDGPSQVETYQFGSKAFSYYFCKVCSTQILGPGVEDYKGKEIMFNLRTLRDQDFNLWAQPLTFYSGKDRPPQYTPTTLNDIPGAKEYLETRAKDYEYKTEVYVGSCHCKAVKFAVLSKSLEEVRINDCGCSICLGNGAIWIYPGRRNTYFHPSPSPSPSKPYIPSSSLITTYAFHEKSNLHYSCSTCGSNIYEYRERPENDPRPEHLRKGVWESENGWNGSFGVNIALLERAEEWFGDIIGLKGGEVEGELGKVGVLKVERDEGDRLEEPRYRLEL